jgi:hypothetical protein
MVVVERAGREEESQGGERGVLSQGHANVPSCLLLWLP